MEERRRARVPGRSAPQPQPQPQHRARLYCSPAQPQSEQVPDAQQAARCRPDLRTRRLGDTERSLGGAG
eukprot:2883122-Rhodomonas_salina.1